MTSPNATLVLSPKARGRRAFHTARIAAAPAGSRKRQRYVFSWLLAELANGGDLDEVVNLAATMNATPR